MTVKFGIIGLGKISHRFATVLNTASGVELTAVAARDSERTRAFAQQFNAKKACASYLDVIHDPDVDVVYIGLTHNFHYEIARLCLENHKAVLCEKPLVTTLKETEALIELARKNNTLLMEAMWTRCLPAFRTAKLWVQSGKIGTVKLITANFCYKADLDLENRQFNPNLAGGSLFDVGIYPIDFATGILDEHPAAVSGLAKISVSGIDEFAAVSMSFAGGAMVSFNCGFTVDSMGEAVIYGTKGRIVLPTCYKPLSCDRYDEEGRAVEHFEEIVPDGFIYQIEHCADLFRAGRIESDLIPWADTVESARIFDELLGSWGLA